MLLGFLLISAPVMANCEFSYTEPRTGDRFICEADEEDILYFCQSTDHDVKDFYCKRQGEEKMYTLHIDTRTASAAVRKACPNACGTRR